MNLGQLLCFDTKPDIYCFRVSDTVLQITVMAGESAHLPCHIKNMNSEDRMKLVLWFRNVSDTPFYT